MTGDELAEWAEDFEGFQARFAPFFSRSEPREWARRYVRGLLSSARRKNCWQMAEEVGQADPQGLQRLLYSARWDADEVCGEVQRFVVEQFGHEEGIGVLDETAFAKKGDKSVGVKRQWCNTLGKVENCQVGVFLTYVSPHGYAFLDRRLYLPREWCDDLERRRAAGVPDEVVFQTKPELGKGMLAAAWASGVPMAWVTADECYGDAPHLRDWIDEAGYRYVMAVSANTRVWRERPALDAPAHDTGGRPRTKPRLAPDALPSSSVAEVVASWPEAAWQRLTTHTGEKGPRTYDWACGRVIESRDGLPETQAWLVARRSIDKPHEIACYLSNAPDDTPLLRLAQVASSRWTVEQCFEESKGETGLDEYEVRYWHSWHRHVTLSMMAHAWLTAIRRREGEKIA